MIIEDYVSFETAKLLKERGFNEECLGTYNTSNKELSISSDFPYKNDINDDIFIAAPTHQRVMKWLREVHKIFITIYSVSFPIREQHVYTELHEPVHYHFTIEKWSEYGLKQPLTDCGEFARHNYYDEAVECAINCCLENLV